MQYLAYLALIGTISATKLRAETTAAKTLQGTVVSEGDQFGKPDDNDDVEGDNEEEVEGDDDSNLQEVTQAKVSRTCLGAHQRKMREAHGKITVPQGKQFEDVSFPADPSSISWTSTESSAWNRPGPNNGSLWGSKGVRPAVINQGKYGDSWLLASLAAIAEYPDRIKKIFNEQDAYPTNGQFVVNMWDSGVESRIHIDDRIPSRVEGTNLYPIFTRRSSNGAWWATFAEKAAAEYYGTYGKIGLGWMTESLYAFTGQPTLNLVHPRMTEAQLWERLSNFDENKYIMTSTVMKWSEREQGLSITGQGKNQGLVRGHAYTTLGVATHNGKKFVKARNPWGRTEFDGAYSDKDTSAAAVAFRKAVGHTSTDDGTFYIELSNYKTLF
jgi:hypothetical protein